MTSSDYQCELQHIEGKICAMRHGNSLQTSNPQVYCSMNRIARATRLPIGLVRQIAASNLLAHEGLRSLLQEAKVPIETLHRSMIQFRQDAKALDYACKPEILQQMAHLTLHERALRIKPRFPRSRVRAWHIQQEFKRRGIRFKGIHQVKSLRSYCYDDLESKFQETRRLYQRAAQDGLRVVFTDEAIFSRQTQQKMAFSCERRNLQISDGLLQGRKVYVIAAISRENGVESLRVSDAPVDSRSYTSILSDLSRRGKKFVLFGDNASYHLSSKSKEAYQKFNTSFIPNIPYCPRLNPTESFFSLLKGKYRRLWLECVLKSQTPNIKALVLKAYKQLKADSVKNIASSGDLSWSQESYLKAMLVNRQSYSEIRVIAPKFQQLITLKIDQLMEFQNMQSQLRNITEGEAIQMLKQKFGGKRNLYDFLVVGCQKFLPPYDDCSLRFMLQIIGGQKSAMELIDLRPLNVPRLKELKLANLLEEVKNDAQIQKHLPDLPTAKSKHNRQFVCTVIATIKPRFIEALVRHCHEVRVKEGPNIPDTQPIAVTAEYQKLSANTFFACKARRGRIMRGLKDPAKIKPRKQPKDRDIKGSFQKYMQWEATQPEGQQVQNIQ